MGRRLYPFLPVGLLTRIKYPTIEHIGALSSPVLIAHSPDDEIIPFEMGRRIYRAAPEPKTFLEMRGDHNNGFWLSGSRYVEGLGRFLDTVLERP